jgi:hypothetical protein
MVLADASGKTRSKESLDEFCTGMLAIEKFWKSPALPRPLDFVRKRAVEAKRLF